MADELFTLLKSISETFSKNDRMILEVIQGVIDKIKELEERIEKLEDER